MNGIADGCGWSFGNSGNGFAPVGAISLNLVLISTRHGNGRTQGKATGTLPTALS